MTARGSLRAAGLLVCSAVIGAAALFAGCDYPTAPPIDVGAYSVEGNLATVILERVPQLSGVGGSASIADDNDGVYLVIARTGKDSFAIVSNACTHQGKPLGYDPETGLFVCASGKSEFRPDGTVVRGPAEQPLKVYHWRLERSSLIIEMSS